MIGRYHDEAQTETVVTGQLAASEAAGRSSSSDSTGDAGHRYIRDPSTGSLTITGARMEDDGVWGCQAKEATSKRVLHAGPQLRLIVLGESQVTAAGRYGFLTSSKHC